MQKSFFYLFLFFLTHSVNTLYAQEKFDIYRWNEIKNEYDFDFKTNNKNKALDSLNQIGFYTLQIDSIKTNKIYLNKGKNYKTIWVKNESIFKNSDYNPTNNLDSILSKIIDEKGPDHDKTFIVEVKCNGEILASGEGKTKKSAEMDAAKNALNN